MRKTIGRLCSIGLNVLCVLPYITVLLLTPIVAILEMINAAIKQTD